SGASQNFWVYISVAFVFFFIFFFSSRRRHTRWPRDWSSDVCSSDLTAMPATRYFQFTRVAPKTTRNNRRSSAKLAVLDATLTNRSEERRVGKECRSRWSRDH